jgi:hypothetical protein
MLVAYIGDENAVALPPLEIAICAVQQLPQEAPNHCPKCDGVPRLYLRLPNTKNQSTVYVYRCVRCATLIWADEDYLPACLGTESGCGD